MRLSLTKRGEYGVRVLMHLATLGPGERMTAAQLADTCDIPGGNLPTIMSQLSRAHLVQTSPGRSGGCALARDPSDITALEVIEALEGPMKISHCLLDSRRCGDRDRECAFHRAWIVGREAAMAALGRTSLADVVAREAEITQGARAAAANPARGTGPSSLPIPRYRS